MAPRTRAAVKIFAADDGYFEAEATVIYSNSSLGMGLVFRQVEPDFLAVLRKWLLKAMQQSQADEERPPNKSPLKKSKTPIDCQDMALSEAATSAVVFGTPEAERGRAESRAITDSSPPGLVTRLLFALLRRA